MASDKGTNRDHTQDAQKSGTGTNHSTNESRDQGSSSTRGGMHQGSGMSQPTGSNRDHETTTHKTGMSSGTGTSTGTSQNRSSQDPPRDAQGQFTGGGQTSSGNKPGPGSHQGSKQGSNR